MNKMFVKIKNSPENIKATVVFGISSFATSGINYITTPIFTRLLSTSEYGTISLYNSWYTIIQVFASLTLIYPGVLNVGLYDHREHRWKYLSSMLGITTVSTVFLGILYVVCNRIIDSIIALPGSLMFLMLIQCLFLPATTFWTFKQRYEYKYKITFIITVGSALVAQIVSVIAVVAAKSNGVGHLAEVRLWSAGIVNVAVAIALFIYICKKGKQFVDFSLWKTTCKVAIPLIPHYLSSALLSSTDKIMISIMVGDDKTGIYSLAATLSSIGVLLWRALSVTYTPFVNAMLGERKFSEIRSAVKPLLFMVGVLCIITALAGPEIIKVLATEEYLEGIYIVPPVAAGIFLHSLYDNFTAISFFHKKSICIMTSTLTAAMVNIILNYICITRFGYLAAGYTTLISNLVLTGMHYWSARRAEKEVVYDPKFSWILALVVILCCLACNLIYQLAIIRYLLILVLLVVMALRLKKLWYTLKDMRV